MRRIKYFRNCDEVILTKNYRAEFGAEGLSYYEFYMGELFKIISSENDGFILENSRGRFYFNNELMEELFKIREDIKYPVTDRRAINKAFAIANNAIYFNDRSDYLGALYDVCKVLNPKLKESLIGSKYIEE